MNDPSVLSLGAAVLNADINSDLAREAGISPPYPGFQGNVAQALRKYPQYQGIEWRGVPTGESQYHALEVVLERRFSQGLQARVGYTYSRLRNNGAESAQGNEFINDRIQNPAEPFERSLSSDDTPHVLLAGFTWEIPGSERWTSGLSKALLGGWNVSGMLRYESGRPLNIVMANDLFGFLFNSQKRPNRGSGDAVVPNFDGTGSYFNREAWSDPGPLQFGSAPRHDGTVRDFGVYSEDINIFKVFQLTGTQKIRFETQIGNLFNRTLYCTPDTNFSSGTFGTVNVQCNTPRSIQFGFRYDF
jgi:hypothetical protein